MFLFPDGTLVIQLVNFAIFFAILNVVFLRPVAAAIRRRREHINGLVSDYDRYQAEAKVLRDRAESVRAAARREAQEYIASSGAETSNEIAELATTYARKAQTIVREASQTVEGELETARGNEESVVRALAELMLDRVAAEAGA